MSTITDMLGLLTSFSSKTGTSTDSGSTQTQSGGTTTKQTILDQDTMNAMLKSALEGTSGLASVASGQNSAGMYNSSTNTMLTNDLLSRLATSTAIAGAATTTTTPSTTVVTSPSTKTTVTPAAVSATTGLSAVAGVAGLSGAKNLLDTLTGKKKGSISTSDVPGTASSQSTESISQMAGETNPDTAAYLNSADGTTSVTNDVVSASNDVSSNLVLDTGSEIGSDVAGSLAGDAVAPVVDAVGSALADTAVDAGTTAVADTVGEAVATPAAEEVGSTIADAASSWCFLTTAVCEYQLKPDNCYELETLRKFRDGWLKENHPADIETYYAHAPAIVAKIKASHSAVRIFDEMYFGFILPALKAIEADNFNEAYKIYKSLYNYCVACK